MSSEATVATWELESKHVSSTEKFLLLSLARRSDEHHQCWPSLKRISADTGMDRKWIISNRKKLIQKGLLEYTGERRGKSNQVPVMRLLYVEKWVNNMNYVKSLSDKKTDSDKSFTSGSSGTSTLSVTPTSTRSVTGTSTRSGTLNIKEENNSRNNKPSIISLKKNSMDFEEILKDNPFGIPKNSISDWVISRIDKKIPVTQRTWDRTNGVLRQLQQKGLDPVECFETMVDSGWRGIRVVFFQQEINALERKGPKKTSWENYDDESTDWLHMEGF